MSVNLASFKTSEKFIPLRYCSFRIWPIKRRIRLPLPRSGVIIRRAEEKETDVAIASKMLELLHTNQADVIVLVSGDTDLLPAVRTARSLFPSAQICALFPYKRHNAELKRAVHRSFKVRREQYSRHQLPDPVVLPNGHPIHKPAKW